MAMAAREVSKLPSRAFFAYVLVENIYLPHGNVEKYGEEWYIIMFQNHQ